MFLNENFVNIYLFFVFISHFISWLSGSDVSVMIGDDEINDDDNHGKNVDDNVRMNVGDDGAFSTLDPFP